MNELYEGFNEENEYEGLRGGAKKGKIIGKLFKFGGFVLTVILSKLGYDHYFKNNDVS